jgi:hypothetical protein
MKPCIVHARLALAPLGHGAWKLHLPISWLSRGLVGTDGQSFCSDLLLDIIIPSPNQNQAFRLGMCLGTTPMTCSAHARSHMAWHLGCKSRNKYWWALYGEPETGIKGLSGGHPILSPSKQVLCRVSRVCGQISVLEFSVAFFLVDSSFIGQFS